MSGGRFFRSVAFLLNAPIQGIIWRLRRLPDRSTCGHRQSQSSTDLKLTGPAIDEPTGSAYPRPTPTPVIDPRNSDPAVGHRNRQALRNRRDNTQFSNRPTIYRTRSCSRPDPDSVGPADHCRPEAVEFGSQRVPPGMAWGPGRVGTALASSSSTGPVRSADKPALEAAGVTGGAGRRDGCRGRDVTRIAGRRAGRVAVSPAAAASTWGERCRSATIHTVGQPVQDFPVVQLPQTGFGQFRPGSWRGHPRAGRGRGANTARWWSSTCCSAIIFGRRCG